MKFSPPLASGRLLRRYKRFLADVQLTDGRVITIHCPNTGSMKHCAEPGSRVWFSRSDNPKRKYPHTFELIEVQEDVVAGINTGRANALVKEAIENGVVRELADYSRMRTEVPYGQERSRIDFLLQEHVRQGDEDCYVEVKSVTLGLPDGLGLFPDAVSARGSRHLRELMQIRAQGQRAVLFFCVQHSAIERVAPARDIDPVYADTLVEAAACGVEIIAYAARLTPGELSLVKALPVVLPAPP